MSGLWSRIVSLNRRRQFFEQSLLEWVSGNLGDTVIRHGVPWAILFAMTVWWGWKWRCDNVFGGLSKCRDRVKFVKNLAKEVHHANLTGRGTLTTVARAERQIAWTPPRENWFKLNTDGASHGNPGCATAGGVIRDRMGTWVQGFALNIGHCTASLAELWGIYYGLHIAWEKRLTHVELEVDSELVVGFFKTRIEDTHPLSFLVRLCYGFLSRDWSVRVTHVYREANRLADGLANYAFTHPSGLQLFDSCPDCLRSVWMEDNRGSATSRWVAV